MSSYISSYQRPSGACRLIRCSSDRFGYPSSYNHGSRRYARRQLDHFGRYGQEHRADRQHLSSTRSDWAQDKRSRYYSERTRHMSDDYETDLSDLYGFYDVPNPYDPIYSSPWEHTPHKHNSSQLASLDLRRNRGVSNLTELGNTFSALFPAPPNDDRASNNNITLNLHVLSGRTFTPMNSIQPNATRGHGNVDGIIEQIYKLRITEDTGSVGDINQHLEEQAVGGQSADLEKLDLGQRTMNDWVEADAYELESANAGLGVGHWQKGQPHASVGESNGDNDSVTSDLDQGSNFCNHPKQSGGWNYTSSHNTALENLDENEFEESLPGTLTPTSSEGGDWDYPL